MKRTLIAAAVLSMMAAGSAYAECTAGCDSAELFTATNIYTDIGEYGFITLRGKVDVASSSGATVNNTQNVNIGGADLQTPAQSYTKGSVTTSAGETNSWNNASGSSSSMRASSSSSNADWGYSNTKSSSSSSSASGSYVAGGGFTAGVKAQDSGYQYQNTHASANGYLAAGFIAGIHGGHGVILGGLAAGFTAGLNTHESDNFGGGFEGTASGYAASWGGFAASGKSASTSTSSDNGYAYNARSSSDSRSSSWNRSSSDSSGYTSVQGSVTQHIDTETATTMSATIDSNALQGTSGNVGVNMATGIDNAQSNDAALSNMDSGPVFGSAQIYSTQSSDGHAKVGDFNFAATVGSGVLAGASGNIGVNVASGLGNVQNNSLAVSATTTTGSSGSSGYNRQMSGSTDGGEAIASDQNCQTANAGVTGGFTGSAYLGGGALSGASGNIGVNIASGVGNLQHNGLAVASVTHSSP